MRLRIALGGPRGLSPTIEAAEFVEARERRQEEAEALAQALTDDARRAQELDAVWQEVEDYVAAHGVHGDLRIFEDYRWNEEDTTLCDRVCVSIGCTECADGLARCVTPASAMPSCELLEPVAQLRADLAQVIATGLRPARARDEGTARWRRVHVNEFLRAHRSHGGVRAGDGEPARLGFGIEDPAEVTNRVWIRCACAASSSWTADSADGAAALLAELQAAIHVEGDRS